MFHFDRYSGFLLCTMSRITLTTHFFDKKIMSVHYTTNNDFAQAWIAQNANYIAEKNNNSTIINANQGHNSTATENVLSRILKIQHNNWRTENEKLSEINSVLTENLDKLCFHKADAACIVQNAFNLGLYN